MPLLQSLVRFYHSSIGKKIIVAVTGVVLMGFLVGHLLGNLLVFSGPEALNAYARGLHEMKGLVWVARIGLLASVALHVVATVQLTRQNRAAKPQKYAVNATRKATRASRTMIWTGLTILAFVIYHLTHYTIGGANGYRDPANPRYFLPDGSHNAYNMVIDGFSVWYVSAFYIIALFLLCSHLSHGFASVFQTLGLATPRTRKAIGIASHVYAWGLFIGYTSIPLAILLGLRR